MPGKPVAQPAHRAAPGAAPPRPCTCCAAGAKNRASPRASRDSRISCEPPDSQVSIAKASSAATGFLVWCSVFLFRYRYMMGIHPYMGIFG
ncbi:hypothetical protein HMPREF9413_1005 [Paenibacillus sp. HGF7]|nr:hypothetical protein HMPREF9413_1005 [Paenibacillus sp. HGF7]